MVSQLNWLKNASQQEQIDFLMNLRVTFEDKMHDARRTFRPGNLIAQLRSMHEFLKTMYLDEIAIATAEAHKLGDHGQSYDFWPEMLRDISQYYVLVSRLTGDFSVYQLFVQRIFKHFPESVMAPDCYYLLKFEEQQVRYMLDPRAGELRVLHHTMERAIGFALSIGNVERAASVALSAYFTTSGVVKQSALEYYKNCVILRPSQAVSDMYVKQRTKHVALFVQMIVFAVWRRFTKVNISDLNRLNVPF